MQRDLIFDIGAHRGEDTDYYLKKGFRVVAVEADPALCAALTLRFAADMKSGRLSLVNKAIADKPGTCTLYRNDTLSVWNTSQPEWVDRYRSRGTDSIAVEVEATTTALILAEHGVPYYAKIDIEGTDMIALRGFASVERRPKYISIESDLHSFRNLKHEFATLEALGYDAFKIAAQHKVPGTSAPVPAREGKSIAYRFEEHASGAFGDDLPGRWMSQADAIEAYRSVFLRYALIGEDSYVRNRIVRRLLKWYWGKSGWHDTHARHRSAGTA